MSKFIEEIQSLQKQMSEKIESAKADLAEQLHKAGDTLKGIHGLGIKDVLKDKKFAGFMETFGIQFIADVPAKTKGIRGANNGKKVKKAAKTAAKKTVKAIAGVTGSVLKKVSDAKILKTIGADGATQTVLVEKYGQLAPKRLKDMKGAGLIKATGKRPILWTAAK